MKRIIALTFFLFGIASSQAHAGEIVQLSTAASHRSIAAGDEFWIAVKMQIAKGWHTQSHTPSSEDYIATDWKVTVPPEMELLELRYPKGEDENLLGETLSVYSHDVWIGAKLRASQSIPAGNHKIETVLRYQACDDQSCRLPEDMALSFGLEVSSSVHAENGKDLIASLQKLELEKPKSGTPTSTPNTSAAQTDRKPDQGLLLALLGVFISGLLLNLTPCVYPVIAVTIGFFSRQAGENVGQRRMLALFYGLGIAITFTALFVLASLAGVGFGAWLQNPIVLLVFGALIAAFALSYFGLYQIQPPMWLMNKVGGGKAGVLGSFMMGLTMGITAAPCVGPLILGLIIQVAKEGSLWNGLLWGGSLSTGLALPYVFLGFFSGSVKALPKAGDWTEWMERMLGFLLLGVAIWFVNPLLPDGWLLPLLIALLAMAGIWLGLIEKSGRNGNSVWFARGAVCVAGLVGAFTLFEKNQARGIEWQNYSVQALEQAKAQGKPVLIDVTAKWCLPCKFMEETTFKDREVIAESERFVRLKVDLTGEPSEQVQDAIQRFGAEVQGKKRLDPPQLVFLDSSGKEMSELRASEQVGAEELLSLLRRTR